MATEPENKIAILSEFWVDWRDDETFEEVFAYCDIGLPLAFMVQHKFALLTDKAVPLIDETWNFLLKHLDIEDKGFTELEDLFSEY